MDGSSDTPAAVRTRFAPSPTGYLHIGGARTALFNWLFARHFGGTFVLRIEDTDQARSTDESTRAILDSMQWLGLDWDEGPCYQSRRRDIYRAEAERLVSLGRAYYCDCPPEELEEKRKRAVSEGRNPVYDGTCREKGLGPGPGRVIRLRAPSERIRFDDIVKGPIEFAQGEPDDLIILRSDGYPTYNFAVVVDDSLMGITHVIRGDDHVNNTPRQIGIYRALDRPLPLFGHVPMILGEDRSRLSKRHGAVSVTAYRDQGYLPEAMVNYLVRLGWSHGDQEIFSIGELIEYFTADSIGKSSAVFNQEKLLWLNYHYIREAAAPRLREMLRPFWEAGGMAAEDESLALSVVEDLKTRCKTLQEIAESSSFYFKGEVRYDPEAAGLLTAGVAEDIAGFAEALLSLGDWSRGAIDAALRGFAEGRGIKLKMIAQPLRVALTGRTASPGLDQVMYTLGRERVVHRLGRAVDYIRGNS
ncbi:MAG: glutamate--tRNA ligase [Spirochaetes bacterium]|nr:glutamate--tRNA ligase [Spirochaetota bacterium]